MVFEGTMGATSFPGFSPTRPTERERVGENPGYEVATGVNERIFVSIPDEYERRRNVRIRNGF